MEKKKKGKKMKKKIFVIKKVSALYFINASF